VTVATILVVEDEGLIAADIQAVLVGFGYQVPVTASTTREALRAVADFKPDLVLMDVRLKGGDDGVVTAAAIAAFRPTPFVFLSSYSDDATIARAQGVEPYGYLLKPFNDRELRATVELALQRSSREEAAIRRSRILTGIVNGAEDAIVAVDQHGTVLFANDAAMRAEGNTGEIGPSPWAVGSAGICLPGESKACPRADLPLVRAMMGETVTGVELLIRPSASGSACLYSINAAPLVAPDGRVEGAVAIARDVTAIRSNLWSLRQLSQTDELTGAYNRRGFMEVAHAKLRVTADSCQTAVLFFVDLNELKRINDTLGHVEGSRAIQDTVDLLRATFRESDVVARFGGDEFVVLATAAGPYADVLRCRLQAAVETFNESAGRDYRLSMSVGVAEYSPGSQSSLLSLLEQADKRMYEVKSLRGKCRST
jgi:diguanylate cyclase (GGDEF)-like protein